MGYDVMEKVYSALTEAQVKLLNSKPAAQPYQRELMRLFS